LGVVGKKEKAFGFINCIAIYLNRADLISQRNSRLDQKINGSHLTFKKCFTNKPNENSTK